MSVNVLTGDCRKVIGTLANDSIDSCVTDPPYSLVSIQKRFGKPGSAPVKLKVIPGQSGSPYERGSRGFMGKQWDTGEVVHDPAFWAEVYRVLKPGAHLCAFGGTRTYHRMACAIEDAGFEIRDTVAWLYGTGFPKSLDVSKAIDKAAGAERQIIGPNRWQARTPEGTVGIRGNNFHKPDESIAATDDARQWSGWGTALKPAFEPIVLARKPLSEATVADNVLLHGTGAINIDGCRIEGTKPILRTIESDLRNNRILHTKSATNTGETTDVGRWPANVTHDGSDEVLAAFPDSDGAFAPVMGTEPSPAMGNSGIYGHMGRDDRRPAIPRGDSGSAARFFFSAKADRHDRWGSKHPTVKPVALIRWLMRLVTPPGGVTLDPFAGSGTAGVAALAEGFDAILIESEAEYIADIEARLAHYRGEGNHSLVVKNRSRTVPKPAVDLFTGVE